MLVVDCLLLQPSKNVGGTFLWIELGEFEKLECGEIGGGDRLVRHG